jgi:hypothetical protein
MVGYRVILGRSFQVISLNCEQNSHSLYSRRGLDVRSRGRPDAGSRFSPSRRRARQAVHLPRKSRDAARRRVQLEYALAHATANLRLGGPQRAVSSRGIAARQGQLNLLYERPNPAAAGTVDRRPLGRLADALFRGTMLRHGTVALPPCGCGPGYSPLPARRQRPRATHRRPQRLLKFGVRFSTNACMPSLRSSVAKVA